MSRYRKVLSKVWTDDKVPLLSVDSQLLWQYFLSCQHATPFLLYQLGVGTITDELKDRGVPWSRRRVIRSRQEIEEIGLIRCSKDHTNLLFLTGAVTEPANSPGSRNELVTYLRLFRELPRVPFLTQCLEHWRELLPVITKPLMVEFVEKCLTAYAMPYDTPKRQRPDDRRQVVATPDRDRDRDRECTHGKGEPCRTAPHSQMQKEDFERTKNLTDRDEQIAAINLDYWQKKYPKLDVPLLFEKWQCNRGAQGKLNVTDWNLDFGSWLAGCEGNRRRQERQEAEAQGASLPADPKQAELARKAARIQELVLAGKLS